MLNAFRSHLSPCFYSLFLALPHSDPHRSVANMRGSITVSKNYVDAHGPVAILIKLASAADSLYA